VLPPQLSRETATALPSASLQHIARAGHFLPVEMPAALAAALLPHTR